MSEIDWISRQAAIDAAKDWYEGLICGSFRGLEKRLKSLPSAQPEQKKGEWIETEFLKLRECSCCHVRWGMYDVENFNFCPNCGAEMKGESNG